MITPLSHKQRDATQVTRRANTSVAGLALFFAIALFVFGDHAHGWQSWALIFCSSFCSVIAVRCTINAAIARWALLADDAIHEVRGDR